MKYSEVFAKIKGILSDAGIEDFESDAWLIFSHVTGVTKAGYYAHMDDDLAKTDVDKMLDMTNRRQQRVPMQHILGEAYFFGRRFIVNGDVLVPRFDTEVLVERTLKSIRRDYLGTAGGDSKGLSILDMCTGSGCIAITLGLELAGRNICVDASDISEAALSIDEENAKLHEAKINFFKSDIFEQVDKKYDIIVSNPPYIKSEDIAKLDREVREYDPLNALDGGEDGLIFYRRIIKEAPSFLNRGGTVLFEIGCDQGADVLSLFIEAGFSQVEIHRDLAGLERVVSAKYIN